MTTVLNVQLNDLSSQFIQKLKQQFGKTADIEIRVQDKILPDTLFSEADFWQIINLIDWAKKAAKDKLQKAVETLAAMPVSSIYLFEDKLSEKLYLLDTKQHAHVCKSQRPCHELWRRRRLQSQPDKSTRWNCRWHLGS